jgi:hypothetical protein
MHKNMTEKPERKRPCGRPRLRWRILLKLILSPCDVKVWTGFI